MREWLVLTQCQDVMLANSLSKTECRDKTGGAPAMYGRGELSGASFRLLNFVPTLPIVGAVTCGAAFAQERRAGGPTPSPEGARVYFVRLDDGATIPNESDNPFRSARDRGCTLDSYSCATRITFPRTHRLGRPAFGSL